MSRIIREIELHPPSRTLQQARRRQVDGMISTEFAIAAATVAAVNMLGSPLIVVITKSGFSARIVSAQRPPVPILTLTDNQRTCNRLTLYWGVIPHVVKARDTYTE